MAALWENHNHEHFFLRGTGCMLCRLLEPMNYPLAILQLARQHNYVPNWMPAEKQLFELIGTEAFRNKLQREINIIKNMPKKTCTNCSGTVTIFIRLKKIAIDMLNRNISNYKGQCHECGMTVSIGQAEMPEQLMKSVNKYIKIKQIRRAKRRKRKKGIIPAPELEIVQIPEIQYEPDPGHDGPYETEL
jgi:hypothetical protein